MAIEQADNIQTGAPKPTDSRYYNNLIPYLSCSEVNSTISSGVRYSGLTVNILGTEYWYKDGITDPDLVEKTTGGELNWTGSTANALGTYVDGTHICAEPNITWDGAALQLGTGAARTICIEKSVSDGTGYQLIVCAGTAGDSDGVLRAGGALAFRAGAGSAQIGSGNGGNGGGAVFCGGAGGVSGTGADGGSGGGAYIRGGVAGVGDNIDGTGGNVYICGGHGDADGHVFLYSDTAKKLETIGAGVKITGGLQITDPATKSTETNILYIASDGTVASGATSGGATYWSGDTNGISNSGLTNVGIGVVSNADYGLSLYNAGRYGMSITNCLDASYNTSIACASGLLLNNEFDGTTSQQNFTNVYLSAHGTTQGSTNYHATISAVHANCPNHEGFLAIQGRGPSVTCEMMRLCNTSTGVVVYLNGTTCQSKNIEFCQGATRTICVAQATDGGAGDSLNICAGAGDDDTSPLAGGNLRLEGGTGSADTDTGNGGVGGYGILCGGVGGAGHASANGGIGGAAYVRGGAGGDGDTDGCGGHVYICGGFSADNCGGDVYVCGGSGQTGGCVAIYHDATKRLHSTTTGMYTTGNHIVTSDIVFPSPTTHTKWICGQASTTPSNLLITPSESTDAGVGGTLYLQGGTNSSTGAGGNMFLCGGSGTGGCGDVCIVGGCTLIKGCTELRLYAGADVQLYSLPNSCISLRYNGTEKLRTITNGVCVTGCGFATDWIASSDCRLKECIVPISNALSVVNQLCGVCYQLCDDEEHENRIGLIAQDVESVLPEVVSHSAPDKDDNKYGITDEKLGIKYNKLTAILVEAVKELTNKNEYLQEQINELRNK